MPPLDLDTLVLRDGGADLKAACGCETALSDSDTEERDDDPYAPAPSLRLKIGEDIDWGDVVGGGAVAVLERDDSTKGAGANPKCAARRSVARTSSMQPAPAPRAVAVVIGGLPGKAARDHNGRRRSPCRLGGRATRVFAAGEAAAGGPLAEPGSPKVSCLGGVRSQPRAVAEGVSSGRSRWWAWLVADVVSCFWNGRRERRRPRGSEAD
ncbi:hypothetical protein BAE44_0024673 [Dichanthelium oligosanthes]|uniref:Uncharacterized protein n=1 Tax=Dichanthelium oligosanthes TaxID=888268 RepID=A0A1E5UNB2_9POAL|nr:hypothetical protein BAE44_0024673 [Dichanthelium oligosanthes]